MSTGPAHRRRERRELDPLVPLLVLVFAATAIPVELQFERFSVSPRGDVSDWAANLIGYLPIGIVLARFGAGRAIAIGALISVFAEAIQLFSAHRFASPYDVALNTAGTMIGVFLARRLQLRLYVPVRRGRAIAALTATVAILGFVGGHAWNTLNARRAINDIVVNARGSVAPGTLEAHWTLDDTGREIADAAGKAAAPGRLNGTERRGPGVFGNALRFGSDSDYIDFGNPVALRLMGSLTLTAWINADSLPDNDAAIVSSAAPGFQLDTTLDRGPRAIGFKLTEICGQTAVRYGKTPLELNRWYFVAAAYDADAREMHVYLDGEPDDGALSGDVPPVLAASLEHVYVGKRPQPAGYGFRGAVDDVRVYSEALSRERITGIMGGAVDAAKSPVAGPATALRGDVADKRLAPTLGSCVTATELRDSTLPGLIVAAGMLAAIAAIGIAGMTRRTSIALVGLPVGMLALAPALVTLPVHVVWIIPLLAIVGSATIALALRGEQ